MHAEPEMLARHSVSYSDYELNAALLVEECLLLCEPCSFLHELSLPDSDEGTHAQ